MSPDDLDHIPSIVPAREKEEQPARGKPRGSRGAGASRAAASGSGQGLWGRLVLTLALVTAAVAAAWAWQLQGELAQAEARSADYAARISDLEDRLSDTDEGLSQNTQTMAVKLKELTGRVEQNFSEIDKLWASAWRRNRDNIAELKKSSDGYAGRIAGVEESVKSMRGKVESAASDLAKLKGVAGDLERLMTSARNNQAEVERVADQLNRLDLEFARLAKRVEGNEEWVASINTFRQQVNAALADLNASVRALRNAP